MKRVIFKTGKKVTLNSKLRNGLRVRVTGTVIKNFVIKKEAIVKTKIGNEIHFIYKNGEVKLIGV